MEKGAEWAPYGYARAARLSLFCRHLVEFVGRDMHHYQIRGPRGNLPQQYELANGTEWEEF